MFRFKMSKLVQSICIVRYRGQVAINVSNLGFCKPWICCTFLGSIFYFMLWQCWAYTLVRFRNKTHLVRTGDFLTSHQQYQCFVAKTQLYVALKTVSHLQMLKHTNLVTSTPWYDVSCHVTMTRHALYKNNMILILILDLTNCQHFILTTGFLRISWRGEWECLSFIIWVNWPFN